MERITKIFSQGARKTKFEFIFFLILFLGLCDWAKTSGVAAIDAASCSQSDVSAAIASASPGDTVLVPSGSCLWDSALLITKGIILRGGGIGKTIIKNGIDYSGCSGVSDCYSRGYWIQYNPASPPLNAPFRLADFEIDGNWNGGGLWLTNFSAIAASDKQTKIRVDHNKFSNCGNTTYSSYRALMAGNLTFGVADNNIFVNNQKSVDVAAGGNEDLAWSIPVDLGGPNSFYIEDNSFSNTDPRTGGITSGGQGGRYVWRRNTVNSMYDCQTLDIHGNLGNFPDGNRGTVSTEIYNNNITMGLGTNCGWNQFLDMRGGTNMVFNNIMTSKFAVSSGNASWQLREEHAQPGETCSGRWPDGGIYPCTHQIKDTFIWNNTAKIIGGTPEPFLPHIGQGGSEGIITENVDYWLPTSNLDSDKPQACIENSYYGATDTGKLYKCHPANTWVTSYTPYVYPHPLRTDCANYPTLCDPFGDTTPPAPPSSLVVQ